jgi:hypothetical protein
VSLQPWDFVQEITYTCVDAHVHNAELNLLGDRFIPAVTYSSLLPVFSEGLLRALHR